MKIKKYYTGVGSRQTPIYIQNIMTDLADKLARDSWILRSGGAEGADYAFELGWWDYCMNEMHLGGNYGALAEIYIPWNGFNNHTLTSHDGACKFVKDTTEAQSIAEKVHPAWHNLKTGAKNLHTRNVYQVLGEDLETPSKFLVCWAETDKHGVPKGGTRTSWVLAKQHNISCFNLYNEEDLKRIHRYLEN